MVIQTAAKSSVDLSMGGSGAMPSVGGGGAAGGGGGMSYQPSAQQNMVRIWENTLLGVDKLTSTQTGADVVTDTQLDLKAGHIFGTVKKMSAASKYEVKIPNGVAGIRGTVYDITADGVVKILSGSAVLAYVGPNGSVVTQVVMELQMFDARTGTLSPLPGPDQTQMEQWLRQVALGVSVTPLIIVPDHSLIYVSPH